MFISAQSNLTSSIQTDAEKQPTIDVHWSCIKDVRIPREIVAVRH